MGVETDTRKIKVGTGSTAWTSLSYIASDAPGITEIAQDAIDTALSMGSGLTKSYNDATNTISLNIDSSVVALKSYVDSQVTGLENSTAADYVLLADVGNAGGPAKLDVDGNLLVPKSSIVLEGATANAYETILTVVDPTANRTITFPNSSGTVALTSDITSAVNNLVDAAPGALDTLNELAAAIGDDANYAAGVTTSLGNLSAAGIAHGSSTTNVHGIADTAELATESYVDQAEADANTYADSAIGTAMTNHSTDSTDVHGIVNTADLMLKSGSSMTGALTLNGAPTFDLQASTKKYVDDAISTLTADTTNVHGIADTSLLATKEYADTAESDAITAAGTAADTKISTAVAALTKSSVGLGNVDNTTDANKPVSTATQAALDLKANLEGPTFTGTVVLPSTTSIGDVSSTEIGYVNGVTSGIQGQIDGKASLSGAVFTGSVEIDQNLVVDGDLTINGTTFNASATSITIEDNMLQLAHQNASNTVDLGLVVAYNDGSGKHAGIVRDVSDAKWKLFKDVTDEPATTVNFTQGSLDNLQVAGFEAASATIGDVSNTELQYLNGVTSAIQTQIDTKSPIDAPTFTGTVTVSASGIAFSDGTQTKVGVPSITTFGTERTSSETLASGEQDKFIPINGAVQITLPSSGYSTGQSIDFYQASGTGASFASTNSVVGTPGLKFRTTNSVVTAMKTPSGWLVFGDLLA
jgi:hypothetical protein